MLHLLFAPWGILLLCTRCLSITQRPSQCPPSSFGGFRGLDRRLQTSNCESAAITPLWSSLCLVVSVYWPDLNLDKGKSPTPGKSISFVFSKITQEELMRKEHLPDFTFSKTVRPFLKSRSTANFKIETFCATYRLMTNPIPICHHLKLTFFLVWYNTWFHIYCPRLFWNIKKNDTDNWV